MVEALRFQLGEPQCNSVATPLSVPEVPRREVVVDLSKLVVERSSSRGVAPAADHRARVGVGMHLYV